jgi:hypothetical protein
VSPYIMRATRASNFRLLSSTTVVIVGDVHTYGAESSPSRRRESLKIWCWRRMETISCTDSVQNWEVLERAQEDRNMLHTVQRRKVNWIGHILRRN